MRLKADTYFPKSHNDAWRRKIQFFLKLCSPGVGVTVAAFDVRQLQRD